MQRELVQLICRMDAGSLETQLALQCAPLIVGLRLSNLILISNNHLPRIQTLLKRSGISSFVLYTCRNKSVVFLYHIRELEEYLAEDRVRDFLDGYGYPVGNMKNILLMFRCRYCAYRREEGTFPHEIGVLLGYPLEDVIGFIVNRGQNPLYTGYWKVYKDAGAKKMLFRMFELARETLVVLVGNGVGIQEIMDAFCGNMWNCIQKKKTIYEQEKK